MDVDDGSELFGNATPLTSGWPAANGYLALAEYDLAENGGNEDGLISIEDTVYADLRVWIDSNADGSFEFVESLSISDLGIVAVELDYAEYPRVDQHGNIFRYNGSAWINENGELKRVAVTDVILKTLDE